MMLMTRRALCPLSRATAVRCFAVSASTKLNVSRAIDKEHSGKPFREIIQLPPGALKGLKAGKADDMLAAFSIKSIEQLGAWKHYRAAKAIAVLAKTEVADKRPADATSNINGIVDKAWEAASFAELLDAPPSALQGLAPWTDGALAALGIQSISQLSKWKYCAWSEALTTLAAYERADG